MSEEEEKALDEKAKETEAAATADASVKEFDEKVEQTMKDIEQDKLVEQFMVGEAEKKVTPLEIKQLTKDTVRKVIKLFWRN